MSNLRIEAHGTSMAVAALALLDGQPLQDEAGELQVEQIRRHVEERLGHAERLHQILVSPESGHGAPAWKYDAGFDIAHHVMRRTLPPPGDEQTLLRVCCDLTAPSLDRSRPLWDLWLLDGLADGQVALLLRLHHVVADGEAALELFSAMFDAEPTSPGPAPVGYLGAHPGWLALIRGTVARGSNRLHQVWTLARLGRAPALSWNRPVGSRRVHLLVRGDLAAAKAVAHQHGGKVNDVVLAAIGGGAYRLLESRGELAPDLDMRVSVAASIRRPGESGGNRVGVRLVAVPVGDPDAAGRLATVSTRTAEQRHWPPLQPSGRFLQRLMVRIMRNQRIINLVLSNMPGPPAPLWFDGALVREMFQLSLLQGNCAIGVGVLSYAGQLNLDIVADPDIVPDIGVFADEVTTALAQLGAVRDDGDLRLP